jgi:hypothetical protein
MSVVGVIIFVIAQIGYDGVLQMAGVNKFMSWITSIVVQTLLLYVFAMVNALKLGLDLVPYLGCGFVGLRIILMLFKRGKLPFEGIHYFDAWMVGVGVIMGRILYVSPLLHYDNYSHWALIVKYLLTQGHLPVAADPIISFTSYPPATALFITEFVHLVGFSDGGMLLGQFLIIWASLYGLFSVLRDRTRSMNSFVICMAFALVNVFNIAIRMNNLLVDFVLPLVAAAGIAGVYTYRHHRWVQLVTAALFSAELFLIKNSGAMYVVMIGFFLLYWVLKTSKGRWHRRLGQGLGVTAVAMGLGYLPFFWWNQHVHETFKAVSKHQISTEAYKSQLAHESMDVINKIGDKFLHQIMSLNSLSTRGVLVINVGLLIAWFVIRFYSGKRNNLFKTLLALDLSFIAYYISVFAMYIVSMPYAEAIQLDGSERYLSSMVILNMLLAACALVVAMDRAMYEQDLSRRGIRSFHTIVTKNIYQLASLVFMLFSTILMFSEINGIKYNNTLGKEELPVQLKLIAKQTMKYNHTKILLVDPHFEDVDNYYAGYAGRYYFFSDQVVAQENFMMPAAEFKQAIQNYEYVALPEWHRTFTVMLKKTYHQDYKTGLFKVTKDGLKKVKQVNPSD